MKFLAIVLVCSSCAASNPDTASSDTIRVKVNETFELKLSAVMASGFSWSLADSVFMKFVKLDTTYTIANSDREGDPELQVFRFSGVKKGETKIHFIHVRPWRKTDPPTKEKLYDIIVQ
jgi:predicted secreted protein